MKRIQRLIATFVLTMALALSAVAGNMPGPGVAATDSTGGIDPVTAFTLNLLQSLLALF